MSARRTLDGWRRSAARPGWPASTGRAISATGASRSAARALGALRELGEEEDGYITDDGEGLRIWLGDGAFSLEPAD